MFKNNALRLTRFFLIVTLGGLLFGEMVLAQEEAIELAFGEGASGPTRVEIYTVQPGDTMYAIADRFYDIEDRKRGAHWLDIYDTSVRRGLINSMERPVELGSYGLTVLLQPGDQLAIPFYEEDFPLVADIRDTYPVQQVDESGEPVEDPEPQRLTILHTNNLRSRFAAGMGDGFGFDDIAAAAHYARERGSTVLLDAGQYGAPPAEPRGTVETGLRYVDAVEAVGFDVLVPGPEDLELSQDLLAAVEEELDVSVASTTTTIASESTLIETDSLKVGVIGLSEVTAKATPEELFDLAVEELLDLEARGAEVLVVVTQYPLAQLFADGYFDQEGLTRAERFIDRVDLIVDGSSNKEPVYLDDTTPVVSAGGLASIGGVDITVYRDRTVSVETARIDEPLLASTGAKAPVEATATLRRIAADLSLPAAPPRRITILHAGNMQSRFAAGTTRGFGFDEIAAASRYAADRAPTLLIDTGQRGEAAPVAANAAETYFDALDLIGVEVTVPGPQEIAFAGELLPTAARNGSTALSSVNMRLLDLGVSSQTVDSSVATAALRYVSDVPVGVIGLSQPPRGTEVDAETLYNAAISALREVEAAGAELVVVVTQYPLRKLYEQGWFDPTAVADAEAYLDRVDLIIDGGENPEPLFLDERTPLVSAGGADSIGAVDITVQRYEVVDVASTVIDRDSLVDLGAEPESRIVAGLREISRELRIPEEITLLHTSNLQSRLAEGAAGRFGLAHAAAVAEYTRRRRPALLLDAGQYHLPPVTETPTVETGAGFFRTLDALGVDLMVPGVYDLALGGAAATLFSELDPFPLVSTNVALAATAAEGGPLVPTAVLEAGPATVGVFGITAQAAVTEKLSDLAAAGIAAVENLETKGAEVIVGITQYPLRELVAAEVFTPEQLAWARSQAKRIDLIIDGSDSSAPWYLDDETLVVSSATLEEIGVVDITLAGDDVVGLESSAIGAAEMAALGIREDKSIAEQSRRIAGAAGFPVYEPSETLIAEGEASDQASSAPGTSGDVTGAVAFDPTARLQAGTLRLFAAPGISFYQDTEGYGGSVGVTSTVGELFGSDGALAPLALGFALRYDGGLVNDPDYALHNGGAALTLGWELNLGELAGSSGFLSWFRLTPRVDLGVMYQQQQHVGRVGYNGVAYYGAPGLLFDVEFPFLKRLRLGGLASFSVVYGENMIMNAHVAPSLSWRF